MMVLATKGTMGPPRAQFRRRPRSMCSFSQTARAEDCLSTGGCPPSPLAQTLLVVLATFVVSCLGFDPTPPPAAKLVFTLDLPAANTAQVIIYDVNDKQVGQATAQGGSGAEVSLTPNTDFAALRLVAQSGERVLKAVVAAANKEAVVQVGQVGAGSTAAAQMIQDKVAGQGGSLASVPSSIIADLLTQIKKGGAEVKDFSTLLTTLLSKAKPGHLPLATGLFNPLDAQLNQAFITAHAKELSPTVAADYRNKLTAAISRLSINLVCDAARVKVMFTVDVSGDALDGNGAPQLIRQPTKGDKVYLAITVDESSPVADAAGLLKTKMTPNDPMGAMVDDGTNGDEAAGDGVYTRVLVLPRGMRVKYKYTNGSAGEGWTRTEEWPGNARLLEVKDVLSRHNGGLPDCLVVRRDAFGDEASNKNYVNLNSALKSSGGTLGWNKDTGGAEAAKVAQDRYVGGLSLGDIRNKPPLTPKGLAEAAENGVCSRCPAPLTMSTDDKVPPRLISAEFTSTRRIKVSFSESLEFTAASTVGNYLVLDSANRALPITSAAASGTFTTLAISFPDFGQTYTLYVKNLRDASANANLLVPSGGFISTPVRPDRTPPKVISVQAFPLQDFNPGASGADPTVGQVLKVTFDEELDTLSANNAGNFQVSPLLPIKAAYLRNTSQVWLITGAQGKRKPYKLFVSGVRDLAGNLVLANNTVPFRGFALYRATFSAVPGFAFLDLAGTKRGLPSGAKLYLTGTILSVARDLKGAPIGVSGRTDVTGIPEFEMKAGAGLYKGKPIYSITLLAPPGAYAWKVAHGVEGEYKTPPSTLVKVHKSLCTSNDFAGVNIDPATLTALPGRPGSDGKPKSFLDYGSAKLSKTGGDAPGPFLIKSGATLPAPSVMFKRENPDEVCRVSGADKQCPAIVIGTWRDIADFKVGAKTSDYDDGQIEVAPVRIQVDAASPVLQQLTVRDSESLLLTFDERLEVKAADLQLSAKEAKTGTDLAVTVHTIGTIGATLLPHQVLVRTGKMGLGASYTLSFHGFTDVLENKQPAALNRTWTAPQSFQPFTPLADNAPPKVLSVIPKSPTSLVVQFNEKLLFASATNSGNYLIKAASGVAPSVVAAVLQGGGTAVHLQTGVQAQQASYTLVVSNISDMASPPNVLSAQQISFKGFGDSTPPKVVYAAAISSSEVAVAFDEPLALVAASSTSSYSISHGLKVLSAVFSGDAVRKAAAFNAANATFSENIVLLQTSTMKAGQAYTLTPAGVTDLSGNNCKTNTTFKGVSAPPKVDVIFTYKISGSATAASKVPGKAIDPSELAKNREGVFMLGCTVSSDGKTKGSPTTDPVTKQMGGFPALGQPLNGVEPQLLDNGLQSDQKAGDHVYTIRIKNVPLGSSLQWKAFASYTVASGNGFADGLPGPSAYSDGQEYPGNENGVRVLGDKDGDGVVWIHNLFGDEISYKKTTDSPPFVWVVDDNTWTP